MPSYILRNIEPKLWARVKARAAGDGISLRSVAMALLTAYADKTITVSGVSINRPSTS
jgi:hypothetical protein